MIRAFAAGAVYVALVFAAGFVLGTVRVLALAPRLGELGAVAAETPVMLAVSWFACGWTLRRVAVPAKVIPRAVMGAAAFAFLMTAELALTVLAFGGTPASFLATFAAPAGALGLAGQVAFGLIPLARR